LHHALALLVAEAHLVLGEALCQVGVEAAVVDASRCLLPLIILIEDSPLVLLGLESSLFTLAHLQLLAYVGVAARMDVLASLVLRQVAHAP